MTAAICWSGWRGMLSAPTARRICAGRASHRAHPWTRSKCSPALRHGTQKPTLPRSAIILSPNRAPAPPLHPMAVAGLATAPARRKSRHRRSRPPCCCQTPTATRCCSGERALERPSPMTAWCTARSALRCIQTSTPSATHLQRTWPRACLMPGSTICTGGAPGTHLMPQPT